MMSGGYTDPPALAYGNKIANNDAPAVAYHGLSADHVHARGGGADDRTFLPLANS